MAVVWSSGNLDWEVAFVPCRRGGNRVSNRLANQGT
ncbi:hypothetical protein BVRB_7g169690 [Beta vulgaris subsp. vulgaris]|nr:hypothetical protein BVRB_7g169690 [Beta vulgaris subsp. vulgaris]